MTKRMSEASTGADETLVETLEASDAAVVEGVEPDGVESDGVDELGDAGKKALDRMKAKWKSAEDRAKAAEAAAAAAQAKAEGKEKEFAAAEERRKVEADALAKANERILKAEVRAQATAKLADPADALLYLDLSSFEVGDDGDVDADGITAAIDDLLKNKPYLSAQGRRFQGSADGGARKDATVSQLTKADLAGMSPDAIVKAKTEGRLNKLLGIE